MLIRHANKRSQNITSIWLDVNAHARFNEETTRRYGAAAFERYV